ncbi:WD40 repeat domain-containing protein [Nocardia sp. BMG51109]|uniref:WD40 repeat domain-containing protein n=1 Tax=Nocardia sp. BMG51109 TaxID=1056816 RepID=UPI000467C424|nr:WD40 repeat domain-containing protein [Nocardia sp. BMG51109]
MTDNVELFPIAIGEFDSAEWERIDGIDANLAGFFGAFDGFACHVIDWERTAPCCGKLPVGRELQCSSCPDRKGDHYRGHDDVSARLRQWSDGDPSIRSILYWVGHGWSDGHQAALIHSRTSPEHPGTEGIGPERVAEAVSSRYPNDTQPWALVMIEACQSAHFTRLVQNALNLLEHRGNYLLISPTPKDGAVALGSLQKTLDTTFAAEDVSLDRLAKALSDKGLQVIQSKPIPDDVVALERRVRLPANITVDARGQLAAAVDILPSDVKRHFITKAHGGLGSFEHVVLNEQSWYFEGREDDTQQVVSWLRENSNGILVITGSPGSGKSAFLGNLIVQANPAMRAALRSAELLAETPKGLPDNVFDVCTTVTGLPSEDVVARLAEAIGATMPDDVAGEGITAAGHWLAQEMRARTEPITIVIDALDEAAFPEELAGHILQPLGQVPTVRLLVGTRKSTLDHVDEPTDDESLLHALGTSETDIVTIRTDRQAIRRFVAHRLGNRVQRDQSIRLNVDRFADAVAQHVPQFLMAQLAVHEVLSNPEWHSDRTWNDLLSLNHQGLFGLAVTRLFKKHPSYQSILVGLAFARGHGIPIHDGVWRTVAQAIGDHERIRRSSVMDEHIERFVDDAAPYVIVDNEYDQTVYRLAHRTFAEHFTGNMNAAAGRDLAIAGALMSSADEVLAASETAASPTVVNPYIRQYLSTHVANAGSAGWSLLADHKNLITVLNPDQVGADAQQSAFGRFPLPPIVEGITNARDWLSRVDQDSFPFAVALATGRTTGEHKATETVDDADSMIELVWAKLRRRRHFRTLTDLAGSVRAIAAIPAPDGGTWLAGGDQEGTIRLWDPVTGKLMKKLTGHTGAVTAMAVFPNTATGSVLVSAAEDLEIRRWDIQSTVTRSEKIANCPSITALAASQTVDGQLLLACASAGTIAILDAADGRILRKYSGHSDDITALTVLPDPIFGDLLASSARDRTLRIWDPRTGRTFDSLETSVLSALIAIPALDHSWPTLAGAAPGRILLWNHRDWDHATLEGKQPQTILSHSNGTVTALAALPMPGRRPRLAGAGHGTIAMWDLNQTQQHPIIQLLSNETDIKSITALAAVPSAADGTLLASAHDGTIRLWNPLAGQSNSVGNPRIDEDAGIGSVTTLATVRSARGTTFLATAGQSASIDVWDSESGDRLRPPGTVADPENKVTVLTTIFADADRPLLVSGSYTGGISVWDQAFGQSRALTGTGSRPVTAMTAIPTRDRLPILASADDSGAVRLWNTATSRQQPIATVSTDRPITALTAIIADDGGSLLAIADNAGDVRVVDPMKPAAGQPVATFSTGSAAIRSMVVTNDSTGVPLLATAGPNGPIRLFDPTSAAATQPVTTLSGHKGAVTALATWPTAEGHTFLVSGGRDRTIRLWNPAHTTALRVIPVDAPVVTMATLRSDRLAVALEDGLLVLRIDMARILR